MHCYTNTDDNDINYVTDVHKESRYTVIYYLSKCTEAVDWGATNLFSFISFFTNQLITSRKISREGSMLGCKDNRE